MRRFFSLIHRYVGLVMAIFLLIAGLTGATLVWYHELDAAINSQWMQVQPPPLNAQPLNHFVLRDQVQSRYPQAWVNYINLNNPPGEAIVFSLEGSIDAKTGQPIDLPNDEIFVDPYTGAVLGERKWGVITQGWHNLLPFLYKLHYALALDQLGMLLMGIVAVLWTIDCFVGAYLTFPASLRKRPCAGENIICQSWWKRWWPAWKVRWQGGRYKLNFDLHRAGGLWPWAMLFVLAWSSVAFNLKEVYHPVMQTLFTMQPDQEEAIPKLPEIQIEPGMSWPAALETGRELMKNLAQAKGFSIRYENNLGYNPYTGVFRYQVLSDLDIGDKYAGTNVYFYSNTGKQVGNYLPTGETSGDTITSWLMTLHTAMIWGIPFKIFMTLVGLAVAMLSVTGIYIWWKKRRARLLNQQRRAAVITNSINT